MRQSICAALIMCFVVQHGPMLKLSAQAVSTEAGGQNARAYSAGRDIVVNYQSTKTRQLPRAQLAREALGRMGLAFELDSFVEAAQRNDVVAVRYFLQAGMPPNQYTTHGSTTTPLVEAVAAGSKQAVLLMLGAGADPELSGGAWGTPLQMAARHDQVDIAAWLLKRSPSDSNIRGSIREAARSGSLPVLRLLFRAARPDQLLKDQSLLYASRYGGSEGSVLECLSFLLERGARADAVDEDGSTSVSLLARRANYGALELLLRYPTDLEARDSDAGATALWWAAGSQQLVNVLLLVEKGADIDALGPRGTTPLMHAAELGHVPITRFLLERGADVTKGEPVKVHRREVIELLHAGDRVSYDRSN